MKPAPPVTRKFMEAKLTKGAGSPKRKVRAEENQMRWKGIERNTKSQTPNTRQVPNTNLQSPEKNQAPSIKRGSLGDDLLSQTTEVQ